MKRLACAFISIFVMIGSAQASVTETPECDELLGSLRRSELEALKDRYRQGLQDLIEYIGPETFGFESETELLNAVLSSHNSQTFFHRANHLIAKMKERVISFNQLIQKAEINEPCSVDPHLMNWKEDDLYVDGECQANINHLFSSLKQKWPDLELSSFKVLRIQAEDKTAFYVNRPDHPRWNYHVVLLYKDLVLDPDYGLSPVPIHQYINNFFSPKDIPRLMVFEMRGEDYLHWPPKIVSKGYFREAITEQAQRKTLREYLKIGSENSQF